MNKNEKNIINNESVETANANASTTVSKKSKKSNIFDFYKKPGFRYSMLASVLSIVFIVVIVGLNICASMLDERFNAMQLDMTTTKDYSISDQNIEYINKLDKEVSITVAATEDFYSNGSYASYVSSYYYYEDASYGKYYYQTVQLLKKYPKVNNKISVKFVDPDTPEFVEIANKYQELKNETNIGKVIVECSFTNSKGEKQSRYKILDVDDLYVTETSEDAYTQIITASKVETAVTSALFYVSTEQQDKAVVLTSNGCEEVASLNELLKNNNYDIEEADSILSEKIDSDTNVLIIAMPTTDFTDKEIKVLDNYLQGSKEYGKNLVYIASNNQPSLPNLERLLIEWGIEFDEGTVYETNTSFAFPDQYMTYLRLNAPGATGMYLSDGKDASETHASYTMSAFSMRPMRMLFEEDSNYFTEQYIVTSEDATVMPADADSSWKPADKYDTNQYCAVARSIYSANVTVNDKNEVRTSNIIALASPYLFGMSEVNDDVILKLVNDCVGRTEEDSYFVTSKYIDSNSFEVSENSAAIIKYVCMFIVPIIIVVIGVLVVIRRKRK